MDDWEEVPASSAELVLGDGVSLTHSQQNMIRRLFPGCKCIAAQRLHGGFTVGSDVLLCTQAVSESGVRQVQTLTALKDEEEMRRELGKRQALVGCLGQGVPTIVSGPVYEDGLAAIVFALPTAVWNLPQYLNKEQQSDGDTAPKEPPALIHTFKQWVVGQMKGKTLHDGADQESEMQSIVSELWGGGEPLAQLAEATVGSRAFGGDDGLMEEYRFQLYQAAARALVPAMLDPNFQAYATRVGAVSRLIKKQVSDGLEFRGRPLTWSTQKHISRFKHSLFSGVKAQPNDAPDDKPRPARVNIPELTKLADKGVPKLAKLLEQLDSIIYYDQTVAGALPSHMAALKGWKPLTTQIHGDAHAANILCDIKGTPWLINLAKARIGSPFEDTARMVACVLFECWPMPEDGGRDSATAVRHACRTVDVLVDIGEPGRELWEQCTPPTDAPPEGRIAIKMANLLMSHTCRTVRACSSDARDLHPVTFRLSLLWNSICALKYRETSSWNKRVAWHAVERLSTALLKDFSRPAAEVPELGVARSAPLRFALGQPLILRVGQERRLAQRKALVRGGTLPKEATRRHDLLQKAADNVAFVLSGEQGDYKVFFDDLCHDALRPFASTEESDAVGEFGRRLRKLLKLVIDGKGLIRVAEAADNERLQQEALAGAEEADEVGVDAAAEAKVEMRHFPGKTSPKVAKLGKKRWRLAVRAVEGVMRVRDALPAEASDSQAFEFAGQCREEVVGAMEALLGLDTLMAEIRTWKGSLVSSVPVLAAAFLSAAAELWVGLQLSRRRVEEAYVVETLLPEERSLVLQAEEEMKHAWERASGSGSDGLASFAGVEVDKNEFWGRADPQPHVQGAPSDVAVGSVLGSSGASTGAGAAVRGVEERAGEGRGEAEARSRAQWLRRLGEKLLSTAAVEAGMAPGRSYAEGTQIFIHVEQKRAQTAEEAAAEDAAHDKELQTAVALVKARREADGRKASEAPQQQEEVFYASQAEEEAVRTAAEEAERKEVEAEAFQLVSPRRPKEKRVVVEGKWIEAVVVGVNASFHFCKEVTDSRFGEGRVVEEDAREIGIHLTPYNHATRCEIDLESFETALARYSHILLVRFSLFDDEMTGERLDSLEQLVPLELVSACAPEDLGDDDFGVPSLVSADAPEKAAEAAAEAAAANNLSAEAAEAAMNAAQVAARTGLSSEAVTAAAEAAGEAAGENFDTSKPCVSAIAGRAAAMVGTMPLQEQGIEVARAIGEAMALAAFEVPTAALPATLIAL